VNQTREKGATPILPTLVNCNYPWADGKLTSVHGEYPDAVKQVAGAFEAYPNGQKDNTHFQPEGAIRVARLVFGALQGI
jgi:lysophospholipase L1-like esterase